MGFPSVGLRDSWGSQLVEGPTDALLCFERRPVGVDSGFSAGAVTRFRAKSFGAWPGPAGGRQAGLCHLRPPRHPGAAAPQFSPAPAAGGSSPSSSSGPYPTNHPSPKASVNARAMRNVSLGSEGLAGVAGVCDWRPILSGTGCIFITPLHAIQRARPGPPRGSPQ